MNLKVISYSKSLKKIQPVMQTASLPSLLQTHHEYRVKLHFPIPQVSRGELKLAQIAESRNVARLLQSGHHLHIPPTARLRRYPLLSFQALDDTLEVLLHPDFIERVVRGLHLHMKSSKHA